LEEGRVWRCEGGTEDGIRNEGWEKRGVEDKGGRKGEMRGAGCVRVVKGAGGWWDLEGGVRVGG